MDYLWIILGILFMIGGVIGCFLPVLPGPPLSYIGILFLQLKEKPEFETGFLIWWAVITVVITIFDYVLQPLATKKFGGSKKGIWGSAIGLLIGVFFFPPFGIILGPLLGALIGELLTGKQSQQALKSALGSFTGFLAGTLLKLVVSLTMVYFFVEALIS